MSLSKANSETALDSKTKANGSGANRNQPIVEKLLNRYIKLLVEKPVLTKGLTRCVWNKMPFIWTCNKLNL